MKRPGFVALSPSLSTEKDTCAKGLFRYVCRGPLITKALQRPFIHCSGRYTRLTDIHGRLIKKLLA